MCYGDQSWRHFAASVLVTTWTATPVWPLTATLWRHGSGSQRRARRRIRGSFPLAPCSISPPSSMTSSGLFLSLSLSYKYFTRARLCDDSGCVLVLVCLRVCVCDWEKRESRKRNSKRKQSLHGLIVDTGVCGWDGVWSYTSLYVTVRVRLGHQLETCWNRNDTNCLVTKDAVTTNMEIQPFLASLPGQVYPGDQFCQLSEGPDSYICRVCYSLANYPHPSLPSCINHLYLLNSCS